LVLEKQIASLTLYLLIFVSFTNLTEYWVQRYGLHLLPVLLLLAGGATLLEVVKSRKNLLSNYKDQSVHVIFFFFFIFIAAGLINADLSKAFKEELYPLLVGFFIFNLILLNVQERKELDYVLLVSLLSGMVLFMQSVYMLIREIMSLETYIHVRLVGWWGDPNAYAFIMSIVYLLSFYFMNKEGKGWSFLGYLSHLCSAGGILLSLSRGGILVLILISLFNWRTLWRHKFYLMLLIYSSAIVYMVVYLNVFNFSYLKHFSIMRLLPTRADSLDNFLSGRLTTAATGLLIYARHPFTGAGFGNILDYAQTISQMRLHTHNMYIQILAIAGPLPMVSYIFMLGFLWFSMPGKVAAKINYRQILGSFIIALAAMGLSIHFLLYLKPVWIFLSLFPLKGSGLTYYKN